MKANRAFREDDEAGPEIIGAMILFGLFVTIIAVLNITAVPAAGRSAEEEHWTQTLAALNGLQSESEVAAIPGNIGASVATSLDLGPGRATAQDFFSYFIAAPARASGELMFQVNYGNVTLSHYRSGNPSPIVDVGNLNAPFPYGRLSFDPHPIFRDEGVAQLESGGIVTTSPGSEILRYAPPVSVSVAGSTTNVAVKVRVLNGTDATLGGIAPVRLTATTEASSLNAPNANNARNVTLRIETSHGKAWGAYLNATSAAAGLTAGSGYTTTVIRGTPPTLDVVTWTVEGTGAPNDNDVRLTTGLAVFSVAVG